MLLDILISDYIIVLTAFSDSLNICTCPFSLVCLQSAETVHGHSYTYADLNFRLNVY